MLGYLIRKYVRELVRVEFKDGLDASGYLYSMNTVELPIVRFRGWWVLKNQVGSERVRFHSNEVKKVSIIRTVILELSVVGTDKFVSDVELAQEQVSHLVDASHIGNGITVSTEDVDPVTLSTDFPAKFEKAFGADVISEEQSEALDDSLSEEVPHGDG